VPWSVCDLHRNMGLCLSRDDSEDMMRASTTHVDERFVCVNKSGKQVSSDYDIGRVVGSGAFGEVRTVCSKRTGEVCALKVVAKEDTELVVLSRELEILSGLDHPHIARMFDVYEDRRCVHMVLEMCEGGDLVDVIQSSTQGLREADAFRLTGQLLWAVSYLHSKCIAHRDVKLDNLLLKEKVGDVALAQVKLIDFGMSKRFDSYNRLRTVGGTALYAAPEIMSGVNPGHRDAYYTEKVDVWSCGVSCYVLLTRRFPFDGPSDASILENASRAKVRFRASERISEEGRKLVARLLTRAVSKRPSAAEAMAALDALMASAGDANMQVALLKSLEAFRGRNRLEKHARRLMARKTSDSLFPDLQAEFRRMDTAGTGVISFENFKAGMAATGFTDAECLADLFQQVDTDGSQEIDYTEFLAVAMDRALTENRGHLCHEAFRLLDKDNSGTVSVEEIAEAMASPDAGDACSLSEAAALLCDADTDGDGQVSYEEFHALMTRGLRSPTKSKSVALLGA